MVGTLGIENSNGIQLGMEAGELPLGTASPDDEVSTLFVDLYVAGFGRELTLQGLSASFSPFGEVASIRLINAAVVSKSNCAAIVEMRNLAGARAAIRGLDGKTIDGLTMFVLPAIPRAQANRVRKGH